MTAEATQATAPELLQSVTDGVLTLTLNRPEVLNAITPALLDEVTESLRDAAAGRTVRAVIITGAGRGFCSGQDLRAAVSEGGLDVGAVLRDHYTPAIRAIRSMDQPVIAAVNGVAAGAGFSLALACDLRIAADSARLVTAFARVGFSGDFGGTWLMTRLVGPARAKEFYFLADPIEASQALALGLVNRVVPAASLKAETDALAKRIASGPAIAYGYMKSNINAALTADFRTLLDREATGQTLTGRTEDHKEAVAAFVEKRRPVFKGR